jgi:hypothetical protein
MSEPEKILSHVDKRSKAVAGWLQKVLYLEEVT